MNRDTTDPEVPVGRAREEFALQELRLREFRTKRQLEYEAQLAGRQLVATRLDQLPLAPDFVHAANYPPGTYAHLIFELSRHEDIVAWREITASIMAAFPPCPLFRFKSSTLSFTPELTPEQGRELEEDREGHIGQTHQVAPFTARLVRYNWSPSQAELRWFHYDPSYGVFERHRVEVTVRVGGGNHGSDAAGMFQRPEFAPEKRGQWDEERRVVGYTAVVPCPTYRVDLFWADGTSARPAVAWWDLSCLPAECCDHSEGAGPYALLPEKAGAAFLRLTAPPGGDHAETQDAQGDVLV